MESIVSFPNAGRARKVSDGTGKVTVCRFKGVRGVRGKLYIIICIHSASRLSDPRSPCLIRQHKSDINSSLCASPICDKHWGWRENHKEKERKKKKKKKERKKNMVDSQFLREWFSRYALRLWCLFKGWITNVHNLLQLGFFRSFFHTLHTHNTHTHTHTHTHSGPYLYFILSTATDMCLGFLEQR